MHWSSILISSVPVLVAFVLGIVADPIKVLITDRRDRKRVRRELYKELGRAIAHLEEAQEVQTIEHAEALANRVPGFEGLNWYVKNKFDVILRLDPEGDFRMAASQISNFWKSLPVKRNEMEPDEALQMFKVDAELTVISVKSEDYFSFDQCLLGRMIGEAKERNKQLRGSGQS